MAFSYRLCDADRARLGCPEWLPIELASSTLDDITYLSDRFGFDLEDWPEVLQGEIPFEAAGTPDAEDKRQPPKWATQAMLWLALHQADVPVAWEDVGKIQVLRVQRRVDEDDDPGKEPADDGPEKDPALTSDSSTTPPSSTSSPD